MAVSGWQDTVMGNKRVVTGSLAFDSSYPTGGESLTARDLSMSAIDDLYVYDKNGYSFEYNRDAKKVKVFYAAPAGAVAAPVLTVVGGQAAGSALQMLPDADAGVIGKTAATTRTGVTGIQAPAFTGTKAALAEVDNATDLSTLTGVRFRAEGA